MAVQSVDNYDYRNGNAVNNVFRPYKAAEIDRAQSDSNNCRTCTGDCNFSENNKIFNAQGYGFYGNKFILEFRLCYTFSQLNEISR